MGAVKSSAFKKYINKLLIMRRLFFALLLIMLVSNCEKKSIEQEEAEADQKKLNNTVALTTDIEKGRMVYFANCVSCHNNNPKKPGSIGPEVYGASIDVLTQKIVFGKYPENYRPKRTSKIMPLMPHLNKEISNLHAFINSS
tara:strand:+ start:150 stop:575 length:426 start_codon:yes stop_codon:yes gene_type:complete